MGGGVPAVARFIRAAALRSGTYDLAVISLATSAHDPCNVTIANPASWLRGVATVRHEWESAYCHHIGAFAGEFEFQRYRPRSALKHALANCDLIQVVCGSPAWANAVSGLDKPVAMHVATLATVERRQRDVIAHGIAGAWRKRMTRITDAMDHRALRRVDSIQAMNPWMLDYARKLNTGREVDICYAPPGIDATVFRPLPDVDRSEPPYILCVGRLNDPRKNVDLVLDAFVRLPPDTRCKVKLKMAGVTAPPDSFWRHAEAYGVRDRICYVACPDQGELLRLYQHATTLALPSDEEGFGMVVIEAMACGVPVVATRCGGPEGIITDGDDGFLVPRDDATAMAARLQCLLEDHAHNTTMGAGARRTVELRYDERIAGAVFIDMWDRLLHQAKAKPCAG
jgi:glycosyltransferase involved in cell wall biosynthesis